VLDAEVDTSGVFVGVVLDEASLTGAADAEEVVPFPLQASVRSVTVKTIVRYIL
jgi:hypothetical protein